MKQIYLLAFAVIATLQIVAGSESKLWSTIPFALRGGKSPNNGRVRTQLQSVNSIYLNERELDFTNIDNDGSIDLELPLPSGEIVKFKLYSNGLVPPELSAKYPNLFAFSGRSTGFDRELSADVDYSPEGGLRAHIVDGMTRYYLDPYQVGSDEYKSYDIQQIPRPDEMISLDSAEIEDESEQPVIKGFEHSKLSELVHHYERKAFTIAIATSREYSNYHGNTTATVLAAITTTLNRVSGILKREVGAGFKLHSETDKLICLNSSCPVSNTIRTAFYGLRGFIASKGINASSYDIGHTFVTSGGGLAQIACLCDEDGKSRGVSGSRVPEMSAFDVDIVAHEIGHQLGGNHTFSDCPIASGYRNRVEPGSGSTIMGYAGVCQTRNLQLHADPVYHGVSVQELKKVISSRTCGEDLGQATVPRVGAVPEECTIPRSTPFQLAVTPDNDEEYYYAFDTRTTRNIGQFFNRSYARFRSFIPDKSRSRFFPNLFYIINDLTGYVEDEILFSSAGNISFLVSARDAYSSTNTTTDHGIANGFGYTGLTGIDVAFSDVQRFEIINKPPVMNRDNSVLLYYRGGFTDEDLGISIAIHNSKMDLNGFWPGDRLDASILNLLEWVDIESTQNKAEGTIEFLPILPNATLSTSITVHLMLRSTSSNDCYYFDIAPYVMLQN